MKQYIKWNPGPHWEILLICDCIISYLAVFFAWGFEGGVAWCVANAGTIAIEALIFMGCYLAGFFILKTFNSFTLIDPYFDMIKCLGAILIGDIFIVILNLTGCFSHIALVYRTLFLSSIFILFGMTCIRSVVRHHFYYYGRRGGTNGAYGLSDISLLNMEMEDLLQRDPIEINNDIISQSIHGKKILVTGAAGSIGSELTRALAQYGPECLILVDQAETPLHDLKVWLSSTFDNLKFHTIVTDICHSRRMEKIIRNYKPEIIFHAAAYKHVPMMEDNAVESILNNVDGTVKLADLAVRTGVEKFILISTDKAVNPTNVMGCSKRICEIYCQSLDKSELNQGKCKFITTRFGNVLGSSGSVVPIFREQIRSGGPVKVTHPKIIRFFMLIPEACRLVLEAASMGKGGEIFVFDMGEPVKIVDLAKKMIEISGRKDIKIEFTGLRPGEKLYEERLSNKEEMIDSPHKSITIAKVREYDYQAVNKAIKELIVVAANYDSEQTLIKMHELVPEYRSPNI